jgi:choline dehydrogenase
MMMQTNNRVGATAAEWHERRTAELDVWVGNVFSEGSAHIVSRKPTTHPEVLEDMLTDKRDLVRAADGLARMAAFVEQPAVSALVESAEFSGLCAAQDLANMPEDRVYRWMRETVGGSWHASCSCRMGPDMSVAVVDTRGAVHGVQGLFVADASILPAVTATNLHLTCVMIGEKIADGLRSDWTRTNSRL